MGLTVGQSVASDCYATFAGVTLPENICYPIGISIQNKMYVGLGGVFANNTCTLTFSNVLWEYAP